jgi:hypothetical protein
LTLCITAEEEFGFMATNALSFLQPSEGLSATGTATPASFSTPSAKLREKGDGWIFAEKLARALEKNEVTSAMPGNTGQSFPLATKAPESDTSVKAARGHELPASVQQQLTVIDDAERLESSNTPLPLDADFEDDTDSLPSLSTIDILPLDENQQTMTDPSADLQVVEATISSADAIDLGREIHVVEHSPDAASSAWPANVKAASASTSSALVENVPPPTFDVSQAPVGSRAQLSQVDLPAPRNVAASGIQSPPANDKSLATAAEKATSRTSTAAPGIWRRNTTVTVTVTAETGRAAQIADPEEGARQSAPTSASAVSARDFQRFSPASRSNPRPITRQPPSAAGQGPRMTPAAASGVFDGAEASPEAGLELPLARVLNKPLNRPDEALGRRVGNQASMLMAKENTPVSRVADGAICDAGDVLVAHEASVPRATMNFEPEGPFTTVGAVTADSAPAQHDLGFEAPPANGSWSAAQLVRTPPEQALRSDRPITTTATNTTPTVTSEPADALRPTIDEAIVDSPNASPRGILEANAGTAQAGESLDENAPATADKDEGASDVESPLEHTGAKAPALAADDGKGAPQEKSRDPRQEFADERMQASSLTDAPPSRDSNVETKSEFESLLRGDENGARPLTPSEGAAANRSASFDTRVDPRTPNQAQEVETESSIVPSRQAIDQALSALKPIPQGGASTTLHHPKYGSIDVRVRPVGDAMIIEVDSEHQRFGQELIDQREHLARALEVDPQKLTIDFHHSAKDESNRPSDFRENERRREESNADMNQRSDENGSSARDHRPHRASTDPSETRTAASAPGNPHQAGPQSSPPRREGSSPLQTTRIDAIA